jgi:conjugal transfer pilus assembly protein TraF
VNRPVRCVVHRPYRNGWADLAIIACLAIEMGTASTIAAAETMAKADYSDEQSAQQYWVERERGWFWYRDPPPENQEKPQPRPRAAAPSSPARPTALIEFDVLQKRVEELRNIAIIRPTERNIRNYLVVQAEVIDKASVFADVAQRVIWANPGLDYTVTGRPVNAKALEVFDRQAISTREGTAMALAKDHAMFFFFRSDCAYCHQFGPYLKEFEAKFGLRIVPISVDGGPLFPAFPNPRIDNGIAQTLDVREVPALFLIEPSSGRIVPIGYGVLSESELLERLQVVSQPNADQVVPSATRFVSNIPVR